MSPTDSSVQASESNTFVPARMHFLATALLPFKLHPSSTGRADPDRDSVGLSEKWLSGSATVVHSMVSPSVQAPRSITKGAVVWLVIGTVNGSAILVALMQS